LKLQPLFKLKILILEKFGRQYFLAEELGIRDDILSAYIHRRKEMPEEIIEMIEAELKVPRSEFLPKDY